MPEIENIRKTTRVQGVMSARGLLANPVSFCFAETPFANHFSCECSTSGVVCWSRKDAAGSCQGWLPSPQRSRLKRVPLTALFLLIDLRPFSHGFGAPIWAPPSALDVHARKPVLKDRAVSRKPASVSGQRDRLLREPRAQSVSRCTERVLSMEHDDVYTIYIRTACYTVRRGSEVMEQRNNIPKRREGSKKN